MFPSEMVILMAITINKDTGKKLVTRPMDVTGEYIGYLYDSLVNRGYLKGNRARGYQLTSLGRKALSEFLHKNEARARETLKGLKLLGIEISPEQERRIEKLEKEALGVT